MPPLTLYDLSTSRSIRTAWLLEELHLTYTTIHAERNASGLSSSDFKKQTATLQGKAPVLKDGDLVIQESGAIAEYLCEIYDHQHRLMPSLEKWRDRCKAREFVHAAEGTMMMHALPYIYARRVNPDAASNLQPKLAELVRKDFDWVEAELEGKGGGWLVGGDVTVADTMMGFSVQFILVNKLVGEGSGVMRWKRIHEWLQLVEGREAYKRAVEKTGFELKSQV